MNTETESPEFISIQELLNHFDLDLDLHQNLLNFKVGECLKESDLTINKGIYEFKFKHNRGVYIVTINPLIKKKR